ncbi:MAG: MBL fold metallo-hydrolase, partial [Planctomycetes bacterium]|nr:MBL fold metallo-hydrolase [Planctomycetota bacterium]
MRSGSSTTCCRSSSAETPRVEIVAADRWYRTQGLADGVTLIDEPHIKPFYRCNLWHVRGRDRDLLVDSGMGVVPLRQQVPLLSGRPCLAVASHTHFDHVGAHHEFEHRAVHRAEADLLAAPTRANTLADPYVTDDIFTARPPEPYVSSEYAVDAAPATRVLDDGDTVDLGDRVFEVIHCPGHSPGGIMLFERASGVLFSGDTIYDGPLIDDAYHSDIDAYVATCKRIHDLPCRIVHGGHFGSFDGARYRV